MRVKFWVILGFSVLATNGMGQEVTSTKTTKSPLDIISSQTGNVQWRNYVDGMAKDYEDNIDYHNVTNQVRANFTVGTFDDRVQTTFVLGASVTNNGQGTITQRQPEIYTEWSLLQTSFFDLSPYADIYTPAEGNPTKADLGLIPKLKVPTITTDAGDFDLSFHVEAEGQFFSEDRDAQVRTKLDESKVAQFGIVSTEDNQKVIEDAKGVSYEVLYVPSVVYNADKLVKGLTLRVYAEYDNVYDPVIEVAEDGSRETVYQPNRVTYSYLKASYAFNEKVSLTNYLYRVDSGLYEKRGDASGWRYGNLAILSYTMY